MVDLGRPEARNKAKDERFISRVFNASEVAWIQSALDPDLMLWMMWAAKEAVYKVIQQQNSGALFAHRSLEVLPSSEMTHAADVSSTVRGRGDVRVHHNGEMAVSSFPVEWEVSQRIVHCLARSAEADGHSMRAAVCRIRDQGSGIREVDPDAEMRPSNQWTERELLSARSAESREVRLLAKRLAFEAGLGPVEIVRHRGRRRLGPPLLYAHGEADAMEGWDLTLSHDGAFVAAALCANSRLT